MKFNAEFEEIPEWLALESATGVDGTLGTVSFMDSAKGMVITPRLSGLPPGVHGFHIHEKGDCGPAMNKGEPAAGFAAGGHYDPGDCADWRNQRAHLCDQRRRFSRQHRKLHRSAVV